MNKILSLKWGWLCVCLLFSGIFISCGSSRKSAVSLNQSSFTEWKDPLLPEERRKFNHFFLEAVRLKEKGDMDAFSASSSMVLRAILSGKMCV